MNVFREFVLSKEKKKKETWNLEQPKFLRKNSKDRTTSLLIRDDTPITPMESRFPWFNNRKFLIRRKHASRAFNV